MRKPAYTYVKNKGVDQLARLMRAFLFANSMAYISIKLVDYVNSQAGLCFTWLKLGAFMMNLYVCAPTDKKNCNQVN